MLIRFCGVSSPSYQMITEEELAELFGESPPGSPSQSPSRRIISGAADGVGDKVVAPIGVIDLTPGVRSPIYSEPDVGPLLYGKVFERPKPIQIKIGHLGVETKAEQARSTKHIGLRVGGGRAIPAEVKEPQTKRIFVSGRKHGKQTLSEQVPKETPIEFAVRDTVLVQVRQPQYTKGKLVFFDGRYHIIPTTLETQHPLVKVIPPENIASIAQDIISGEYEIKYDCVEFRRGMITGK